MLMIFLLSIIGLIIFFYERSNHYKRVKFAKEYIASVKQDYKLNEKEKKEKIKQFFIANGFNIASFGKDLVFKRKEFSLGLLLFGAGFFLVGALLYLLYYFYFQKEDEFQA